MPVLRWLCTIVLCMLVLCDDATAWADRGIRMGGHAPRHSRRVFSYPRDWDTDWSQSQGERWDWQSDWESGDQVPEYHYLRPRMEVIRQPQPQGTHGVMHTQQRGSALVPYPGATVRVKPHTSSLLEFYRGVVNSPVTERTHSHRRFGHSSQEKKQRNGAPDARQPQPPPQYWQYSQDEPAISHPKVCARCPSDRAVLAKRGSNSVIMEAPPIIPCNPRSSVKKVKQEIVAGLQPGDRVPEGSHKIVIRLYRHRRTLATCVTRYNVIVRKCGELPAGPGVKVDCPLGKAWGAHCNISCQPGYQLEGDAVTRCADDLEWTGTTPHCIPTTTCPAPVTPAHGQLSCRTPRHQPVHPQAMLPDGSQCHYLCDPGYSIPPSQHHLANIHCVAGTWNSQQDPTCVETNDLQEDEIQPDITADEALRFDGVGCPEGFCRNGGRCIMILDEPMCSCRTGYYGSNCELAADYVDTGESNAIS